MRIATIRIRNLQKTFENGPEYPIMVEHPIDRKNPPMEIPCGKTARIGLNDDNLTKLEINMYPSSEPGNVATITFGIFRHEDGYVPLVRSDKSPDWKPLTKGETVDGHTHHNCVFMLPTGNAGILVIGTVDDLTDPDPE